MANKIIIGHDEVAYHLTWRALSNYFKNGPKQWRVLNKFYKSYYANKHTKFIKGKYVIVNDNDIYSEEFFNRIIKHVNKDMERWRDHIKWIKSHFQEISHLIEDEIPILERKISKGNKDAGRQSMYKVVNKSGRPGFAKTLGQQLLPDADYGFPREYEDADDIFIRNILNNEDIIEHRMRNHKPFWFVDSGYNNFIHGGNKRFHRITRNDLHHGSNSNTFPADRLSKFDSFPQPWRTEGDTILVVEPSKYICRLYGIDITQWRKEVKETLAKHTDKKVVWREKQGTRKTRGNLYLDLLEDESVCCVVHYNSNAGTEAIWAGVPVITLGKHITESVSRNKLSDVNDLYRGDIGNWLCQLSYSQFEFDELMDGTAVDILEKYHV